MPNDQATHPTSGAVGPALAAQLLVDLPDRRGAGSAVDWGLPLLAGLVTGPTSAPATRDLARARVVAWAAERRNGVPPARLFGGGLADLVAGLGWARLVEPRLGGLADIARDRLVAWCHHDPHPDGPIAIDYDLISGVSGVVLALASAPDCRPEHLWPGVRLLLRMCEPAGLAGFRHSDREPDPLLRWNVGQFNYGMGHGLPGVLAALNAGYRRLPDSRRDEVADAMRRLAGRLAPDGARDARGVLTWARGSAERFDPVDPGRQAWCYGTPGVAWQVAETGRLLDERELVEVGTASMVSLCAAWQDGHHLRAESVSATLSLCHGAPGVLALARAFQHRYGLTVAGELADHLHHWVVDRLPDWYAREEVDVTMLDGLAGTLALLLTEGGASPRWLTTLGLR